jgi:lipopolysaccharide/colanic/teichoic acid biosynthesis glycosyltransferase
MGSPETHDASMGRGLSSAGASGDAAGDRATRRATPIALRAKRALDVVVACVVVVALSPVLAAVGLAILATDGRPVLFRQARPGLGGRSFTMWKFRTMRAPRADEVWYDSDAQRVTRLGRFLRSTSLDELPELWNVIRGDMSLVGPRPLLVEYLDHYTPEERRRHDVPPGVTGWAAVNGRNSLGFRQRLALDIWYVDHWSLWLDLRILALTAWKVVRRSDAAVVEDNAAIGFPLPQVGGAERGSAPVQAPAAGERPHEQ